MIAKVVAIRDIKSGLFTPPMCFVALGIATRSFGDVINDEKSEMSKHPEDYIMYHIADYDDELGLFSNLEGGPRQLVTGATVAAQSVEHEIRRIG